MITNWLIGINQTGAHLDGGRQMKCIQRGGRMQGEVKKEGILSKNHQLAPRVYPIVSNSCST